MSTSGQSGNILDEIITANDAALMLNISRRHVTRLVEAGELEGKRTGRDWIITRQSVLAYKAKKETKE